MSACRKADFDSKAHEALAVNGDIDVLVNNRCFPFGRDDRGDFMSA